MKSIFASLASVALLVASAVAQLTINTPSNVVECQPLLITWSGGTAPYFLSVLPGANPTGAALVDLGSQAGTSVTWTVNIAAGTSIGLTLRDSHGTVAQSAPFTVQAGSSACLTSSTSPTSTSATGSAPVSSSSVSTPSTSTSVVTTAPVSMTTMSTPMFSSTTAGLTTSVSKASTSTSASASPTSTGAANKVAQFGVAGAVGAAAAVAALLL